MQNKSYKVFKGLQKPLEFMGLKGRYVWVGLGAAIATILLFIILFVTVNFLTAFVALLAVPTSVFLWIRKSSKRGLYAKRKDEGVFITGKITSW